MKKRCTLLLLAFIAFVLPLSVAAQLTYYNLDFEKTDKTNKTLIRWQYQTIGTDLNVDSSIAASGKACMFANLRNNDNSGGQSFYFVLPESFYTGLRNIEVTIRMMTRSESPNSGLWCKIKKGDKLLGSASTYKGNIPFPIIPFNAAFTGTTTPCIPYSWATYTFNISIDQDPDEVMIGVALLTDRVWFDKLEISINGKLIDRLAFLAI